VSKLQYLHFLGNSILKYGMRHKGEIRSIPILCHKLNTEAKLDYNHSSSMLSWELLGGKMCF